jgi:hypothetical protein
MFARLSTLHYDLVVGEKIDEHAVVSIELPPARPL